MPRICRFGALLLLITGSLRAQSSSAPPDDSLSVALPQLGDASQADVERLLTSLVADGARANDNATASRRIARLSLELAAPITPPESERTNREGRWRGLAVRSLRRALALDSGDVWSASQLEAIAPYPYVWLAPSAELRQLRALASRRERIPLPLATTLIRLEIETGSLDSARSLLIRLYGQDESADVSHVHAELDFASGDTAAARHFYYRGVDDDATLADLRAYTLDLSWIADSAEMAQWATLLPGQRRMWLEAFWSRRDLADAQRPGTRLDEHFRRWRLALRNWRWDADGSVALGIPDEGFAKEIDPGALGDATAEFKPGPLAAVNEVNRWRARSRILDDRGAMVMRHGDPVQATNLPGISSTTEQTLAWATPTGPLVIGFSRIAIGSSRFGMVARNRPLGDPAELCAFDPQLCELQKLPRPPSQDPNRPLVGLRKVIAEEYAGARVRAEHSDDNATVYDHPLGAEIQTYGITNGGILVVLGLPADRLASHDTSVMTRIFATSMRVVVGDSASGQIVASMDTTLAWPMPLHLSPGTWFNAWFVVPAPMGDWEVDAVIGDSTRRFGSGTRTRLVAVADFHAPVLTLSDPVPGLETSELVWHHDDRSISLNPYNAWHRSQSVVINYDIHGMIPGHSYETRYEFWRITRSARTPDAIIRNSAIARQSDRVIRQTIGLSRTEPGVYRLVTVVRDSGAAIEVRRQRRLVVLP
jgi:hypothetical protein